MALAEKQAHSPAEQTGDPKITPTSTAQWFPTQESETHSGERTASSTDGAGKTGHPHAEE